MNDKTLYWLALCDDDLLTAKALLNSKRLLHMGFFCHLIVEKALKATVSEATGGVPPKTHDLEKLATIGGIVMDLPDEYLELLDILGPLNIEARYPSNKAEIAAALTFESCRELLSQTEEFLCWIKHWLDK